MTIRFIMYVLVLSFVFGFTSCQEKKSKYRTETIQTFGDEFQSIEAQELNNKGTQLSKKGELEKAKKLYLEANTIEPNNPTVLNNLGNIYSAEETEESLALAIQCYSKSLAVSDSTYLNAATNLSLAFHKISAFDKGVKIADFTIQNSDDDMIILASRIHKVYNLIGLGECEQAKQEIEYIKHSVVVTEGFERQLKLLQSHLIRCEYNQKS